MVASIVGCFVYYPSQEVLFKEISLTNAETCTRATSGDWGGTLHWIPIYEDQLRKLQVGMYLRGRSMTAKQKDLMESLETALEALEHAADDGDRKEVTHREREVRTIYFEFRRAMVSEDR
jgi:hypothetical protein